MLSSKRLACNLCQGRILRGKEITVSLHVVYGSYAVIIAPCARLHKGTGLLLQGFCKVKFER